MNIFSDQYVSPHRTKLTIALALLSNGKNQMSVTRLEVGNQAIHVHRQMIMMPLAGADGSTIATRRANSAVLGKYSGCKASFLTCMLAAKVKTENCAPSVSWCSYCSRRRFCLFLDNPVSSVSCFHCASRSVLFAPAATGETWVVAETNSSWVAVSLAGWFLRGTK